MKAIILAAGEGSRLHPYTLDRPKCLVEVDGKSLLDRQIEVLKSEGINEIVLIGGYRSEMLDRKDTELRINPIYSETNMVYTLFCAESELDNDLIISYGDIVYSKLVLNTLLKSDSDIAVAIDKDWESYWSARNNNPLDDAETLKLSKDGKIIEIGKTPNSFDEIEGQYMGLMKFSKKGIALLSKVYHKCRQTTGILAGKPINKAYMTDLLQEMIDYDIRIDAVPISGGWVEVDTIQDLKLKITKNRLENISIKSK